MTPRTTRTLLKLHRRCGLFVSLNLVVLSLTGLILVFHEEIDGLLGVVPEAVSAGESASLSQVVEVARASRPGSNAVFLFQEADAHPNVVFVGLAEGSRALEGAEPVAVDVRGPTMLGDVDLSGSFTGMVLELHAELFVGPVGRLLVGLVAVAFLISLITGMIIYGPMMRRFRFGQLRRGRTSRTLVADLHKLLGVASAGWLLVVCVTGLLLSVGSVLLQVYAATELAALGAPYADEPVVEDLQSVDEAIVSAERESGRRWTIVALPGSDLASPRHYTVLLQGEDGLEARLLTMAMVDTEQPTEAQLQPLPWYMRALLLSEPLHFGDYGGLPLKIVWALFGLLTLVLAGSGVWVFTRTRKDASLRARSEALDAQTDLKAGRS